VENNRFWVEMSTDVNNQAEKSGGERRTHRVPLYREGSEKVAKGREAKMKIRLGVGREEGAA